MSTEYDRLMYAAYDRLQQIARKMESLPAAKSTWFLQEIVETQFMILGIIDNETGPAESPPDSGQDPDAARPAPLDSNGSA